MNMDNVDLRYLAFSAELFDCSVDLRLNRYFTHNEILSVLPRPHDHALCELHAVLSGEVVLECEGKRKILRAGELLLLPPATLHRYLSYGEGAALYNLRFRISKRRDSFSHKLYSAAKERFELGAPFTLKASEELSAALASLMSEYDAFVCANVNNGWRLERLRHYAALFFASLFEAASVIPKPCRCEETKNSEQALLGHIIDRYFYYNIDRNISLEELAESISYSKSQTKRILLDLYGISFKEKALRTRIEAAKHYLLSTDFSVDRIALLVGYNSRNGFEQAFLKYVGVLPAELRRGR